MIHLENNPDAEDYAWLHEVLGSMDDYVLARKERSGCTRRCGQSESASCERSAIGRGKNLIVYLEHRPAGSLEIRNAKELMKKMRQILKPPHRGSRRLCQLASTMKGIDTCCSAAAAANEAQNGVSHAMEVLSQ